MLDKADFMYGTFPVPKDFKEEELEFNIDRTIYISRDLKYKLFHFQNHYKLRGKAAVMRFILRLYLNNLEEKGEKMFSRIIDRMSKMWECRRKRQKNFRKDFNPEFVKNTHMNNFYNYEQIEIINSYSITTQILIL